MVNPACQSSRAGSPAWASSAASLRIGVEGYLLGSCRASIHSQRQSQPPEAVLHTIGGLGAGARVGIGLVRRVRRRDDGSWCLRTCGGGSRCRRWCRGRRGLRSRHGRRSAGRWQGWYRHNPRKGIVGLVALFDLISCVNGDRILREVATESEHDRLRRLKPGNGDLLRAVGLHDERPRLPAS